MERIKNLRLRRLKLPLVRPYRLSYRTFEEFEPFLVEIEDDLGRKGFADVHISPGSSEETRDGGWRFIEAKAAAIIGLATVDAKDLILKDFESSKGAATALVTAIEVLEGNSKLKIEQPVMLPLLVPINATESGAVSEEVEALLDQGFRTLKVKVGKDVEADVMRVGVIQKACAGRATLRLDANRAFTRDQGIKFASSLDPEGIDLFEQPCHADDWAANAAVAAASPIPLMLDEPICTLADIERAGQIDNVRYCKVKLKRFGGLDRLDEGLKAISDNGMKAVLGDGLGSEVQGWLEACIALRTIDIAGEFNGFLKPRSRLFENPLRLVEGAIELPAGYWPKLNQDAVARFATTERNF